MPRGEERETGQRLWQELGDLDQGKRERGLFQDVLMEVWVRFVSLP